MAITTTIRFLLPADETRWRVLFRAYREFYELPEIGGGRLPRLGLVHGSRQKCKALVAEVDGEILGFAHHRRFSSPYTGTTGPRSSTTCSPIPRPGPGCGTGPDRPAHRDGRRGGPRTGAVVTAEDNHQAQALYDTLAKRTNWVTYEALPAAT